MTYNTYEQSCSATQLCDISAGLDCPSTASGCNCPTTLAANKCDCPITKYWDASSKACVSRASNGEACVVGLDYLCNYIFISI